MSKVLIAGATLLALAAASGRAEAKMVTYEVDGQRYSYSTNNNAQTAAARRHMAAAQAYAAAKAKVEAERSSNPLASVFGSSAQRELEQAKAALEQARPGTSVAAGPVTAPARPSRERADQGETPAPAQEAAPRSARASRADAAREAQTQDVPVQPARAAVAPAPAPKVKQVSFDAVSGIKTTFMTDGTVHEEPFDGTQLPVITAGSSDPSSLSAFVEKVRPAPNVEATGSTWTAANPDALRQKAGRP